MPKGRDCFCTGSRLRWIVRDNDPSQHSKEAEAAEERCGLTVRTRFLGGVWWFARSLVALVRAGLAVSWAGSCLQWGCRLLLWVGGWVGG